jgi:hypothetical protein
LVINTGAGGDTVTVNNLGAGFTIPLQVNADGDTDTLDVLNSATPVTYTPDATNLPNQGTLTAYGGKTIQFTDFEFVTPVAPDITSLRLDKTVINENDSVLLTVAFLDPGSLSSHSVTVVWGDGTTDTFNLAVGARSFTRSHQYRDDNPNGTPQDINTVQITITDNDNLSDAVSTQVTVNNVPPVITTLANSAAECGDVAENEPVLLTGAFTDVGTLDTHTATIDWGDGTAAINATIVQGAGSGTFSGSHAYAAGGIYTITITLRDDDTGTAVRTTQALITGAGIVGGKLYVIGTHDDDHVTVNKQGGNSFKVHADFFPEGSHRTFAAAGVTEIVIVLCDGDDHATIAGNVTTPALIDGGGGDDHLNGGGGPTVILGGDGNDQLNGGRGRNVLIGGWGADRLVANSDEDLLIAGYTDFDSSYADLASIRDTWTHLTRPFKQRVADLRDAVGPKLDDRSSVHDDGDADKLTGASGRDWFFANLTQDSITDLKATELFNDDPI